MSDDDPGMVQRHLINMAKRHDSPGAVRQGDHREGGRLPRHLLERELAGTGVVAGRQPAGLRRPDGQWRGDPPGVGRQHGAPRGAQHAPPHARRHRRGRLAQLGAGQQEPGHHRGGSQERRTRRRRPQPGQGRPRARGAARPGGVTGRLVAGRHPARAERPRLPADRPVRPGKRHGTPDARQPVWPGRVAAGWQAARRDLRDERPALRPGHRRAGQQARRPGAPAHGDRLGTARQVPRRRRRRAHPRLGRGRRHPGVGHPLDDRGGRPRPRRQDHQH